MCPHLDSKENNVPIVFLEEIGEGFHELSFEHLESLHIVGLSLEQFSLDIVALLSEGHRGLERQ